ncbi:GDP-L-fucose synthase [Ferrovibrio sp.]|uniref:GDP-L-fucose synthase n=1 Tax=Ferrovibrio sp. TaxID=1917215 RepID=UPI0025BF96E4|nr:GDP-L-fucose synthase [Ferrovibrio sp.]MBX3454879.1 GDP-L-fucose synthase [Ferrovibrio sp.]
MNTAQQAFSLSGRRVWVAGHRGMVGSAIVRRLGSEGCDILTVDRATLDLRRQADVEAWMAANKPDVVFVAAATVGGINANNSFPVNFLYDNLVLETNIIQAAHQCDVKKLIFLGSSCIYPRLAEQPMREDALLTGPLEPTNEWYAVAKIAGIKLCQAYRKQHGRDFISAMPTNLYGPGDNFHPEHSHVAAALIARFHAAALENRPVVDIWGSGKPLREFMHVDDLADALIFLTQHYSGYEHINVGSGQEISIADLARMIARISGWQGELRLDASKPDGSPRKMMDSSRLHAMGWRARIALEAGFAEAFDWYRRNIAAVRQSNLK